MSYVVEHEDKTIWEPSRNTGKLFLSQVHCLEMILGTPSGFSEYMSDTVSVDAGKLDSFLGRLIEWANRDNTSIRLLLTGVMVHLLAIAVTVNPTYSIEASEIPMDWQHQAAKLASTAMTKSYVD